LTTVKPGGSLSGSCGAPISVAAHALAGRTAHRQQHVNLLNYLVYFWHLARSKCAGLARSHAALDLKAFCRMPISLRNS